ncbi:mechanosensitive ion channel family protein [Alloiococcus sp. CFN-8]|uniref:mechanosensitive ion channel family protein n=1 Tax=Alloiococcus sp. CFN-8 TaxID=3416081 RepID=UPI003CEB68C7
MDRIINTLIDFALTAGVTLITALFIVILGFKLVKRLIEIIQRGKGFRRIDLSVQTFIVSFISIILKIVIILTAAAVLGVPMTNVVALIGSAGLAIGLSLQGSLSNLAGGLMILLFRPFKVGDYIEYTNFAGTVKSITILYTQLLTIDNKLVVIPNGSISNGTVTNYSSEALRRVDLEFSVGYKESIDKVKEILYKAIEKNSLILMEPEPPFVGVSTYGNNAMIYILKVWTLNENYWPLIYELKEEVKRVFDKNSIEIPLPQLDVHLARNKSSQV